MVVIGMEQKLQRRVDSVLVGMSPYKLLKTVVVIHFVGKVLRALRLLMKKPDVRKYLMEVLAPLLLRVPQVKEKLLAEKNKVRDDLQSKFSAEQTCPRECLPETGISQEELVKIMADRREIDRKYVARGKTTGAVYHGGKEHCDFIGQFYSQWAFTNPLHPTGFPSLRQMDAEVVQMVVNLYNGPPGSCGSFTTGGTESIIVAMKAYREQGKSQGITEPNLVVCRTAHAAFYKAGQILGFPVREAHSVLETQEVDLKHLTRLVDRNTVAIVGSACTYAHGTIDPIEEMSKIASRRGIGLHVDCCLGGFLYPFAEKAGFPVPLADFRVPGVTSISCDPHKYGFTPKGASVCMFRTHELRAHAYSYCMGWTGGIYATSTLVGSRPGGPVAASWAAMCSLGVEGYVESTRQIMSATRKIADAIAEMPALEVVGRPDICVVAFRSKEGAGFNCYSIADCMQQLFDWDLASCQNPSCVHLALTLPTARNADTFIVNLRAAVETLQEPHSKEYASTAGLYGMASSVPATFLESAAQGYLDAMLDTVRGG